jgi:hypothetical protein
VEKRPFTDAFADLEKPTNSYVMFESVRAPNRKVPRALPGLPHPRDRSTRLARVRLNAFGWWLGARGFTCRRCGWHRCCRTKVARVALRVIGTELERPAPDEQILERLRDALRADAEWVRSYTGKQFDDW